MKTLKQSLLIITGIIMALSFTSCDDDFNSRFRRDLVGEWVSTDDPNDIYIIDLYSNGDGRREEGIYYGPGDDQYNAIEETFVWDADRYYIYARFFNRDERWNYTFSHNYLYINNIPFLQSSAWPIKSVGATVQGTRTSPLK